MLSSFPSQNLASLVSLPALAYNVIVRVSIAERPKSPYPCSYLLTDVLFAKPYSKAVPKHLQGHRHLLQVSLAGVIIARRCKHEYMTVIKITGF
jgi:hypothetical protein